MVALPTIGKPAQRRNRWAGLLMLRTQERCPSTATWRCIRAILAPTPTIMSGTWGRLLITPTSRAHLVAGCLIGIFVTSLVQFEVLAGLRRLFFRTNWGPVIQVQPAIQPTGGTPAQALAGD